MCVKIKNVGSLFRKSQRLQRNWTSSGHGHRDATGGGKFSFALNYKLEVGAKELKPEEIIGGNRENCRKKGKIKINTYDGKIEQRLAMESLYPSGQKIRWIRPATTHGTGEGLKEVRDCDRMEEGILWVKPVLKNNTAYVHISLPPGFQDNASKILSLGREKKRGDQKRKGMKFKKLQETQKGSA